MDLTELTRTELLNRAAKCREFAHRHRGSPIMAAQWEARAREAERAIEQHDAEQAKLGAWPGRPLKK